MTAPAAGHHVGGTARRCWHTSCCPRGTGAGVPSPGQGSFPAPAVGRPGTRHRRCSAASPHGHQGRAHTRCDLPGPAMAGSGRTGDRSPRVRCPPTAGRCRRWQYRGSNCPAWPGYCCGRGRQSAGRQNAPGRRSSRATASHPCRWPAHSRRGREGRHPCSSGRGPAVGAQAGAAARWQAMPSGPAESGPARATVACRAWDGSNGV